MRAFVFHREFAPPLERDPRSVCRSSAGSSRSTTTRERADARRCGRVRGRAGGRVAERDFGPRSADDLYILYTGGTTGMPKGVMWRAEDIFFGAFGGGNLGDAPITEPEQITESLRPRAGARLPACPFMHGTAHWMAFGDALHRAAPS